MGEIAGEIRLFGGRQTLRTSEGASSAFLPRRRGGGLALRLGSRLPARAEAAADKGLEPVPPPFSSGHSGPPPRGRGKGGGGGEGAQEARVGSRGPLQGSGPVAQRTEAEGERRPAAGGWCRRRARRRWRSGRASATPILPPLRGLRWSRLQLQPLGKTTHREPGRRRWPGRPEGPAGSFAA